MWEAIASNRRRSRVLVAGMGVLLVGLGYLIGGSFAGRDGGWLGVAAAVVLWSILWTIAVWQGDNVMLHLAGAQRIAKEDAPQLYNVVEEMSIASGLGRMPAIYLIPDDRPNAFAAGRKPETRVVAVTSGLLKLATRDELQGVIAHELGHHRNGDVKLMILLGVMMGAIVILADVFVRGLRFGGRRRSSRDSKGGGAETLLMILAVVLAILAPILAQMMYFACSRRREYLADASAARFTRYPEGLAGALEKISGHYTSNRQVNRVLAPMFIVNPMEALAAVGLFSTHPPTGERVRILRTMAGGAGFKAYEDAARQVIGKGLIGAKTLAEDAPVEPRAASSEPDTRETRVRRAQEVGAVLGKIDGYAMMRCACGVGIKVPPGAPWDTIPCPRCGAQNPVPRV